ncbi:MAG TPA: sigma-70 family RNA polymerase sigma factor, partial [Planctomycetota bacterium]|nr:sigma-70 family RNA polymerase sigma factor [Planctomycetota bacterium]
YFAAPDAPAEDLLQATYLSAIESKERFDATQRVLPWLVGILANHAREARRRNRRAIDPERLRSEIAPDPSDEAAASELSETLDQAIARLPEAYRGVLRLYLEHGLEPAEIARTLERPQGTVRAQLSRGLKQLRRRLPESVVGAQAYALVSPTRLAELRATVLGKVGAASLPVAGSAFLIGFLAMSLNKKLVIAAVLVLAALTTITLRNAESPDRSSASDSSVARATLEPVAEPIRAAPEPVPADRTEVPAPQPAIAAPKAEPATTGTLLVHVADKSGASMPKIGVCLRPFDQLQNLGALLDFVSTDADGNVSFENLEPGRVVIEVDRGDSRGITTISAGKQAKHEFKLGGVRVEGRVVDLEGNPVGGATIWAHDQGRLEAGAIAETDPQGAFHSDCVTPGLALQARKAGFAASKAHPVLGKEGETWKLQLAMEGEASEVAGRVLAPDGSPVANAMVAFIPEAAKLLSPFDRDGPQTRIVQTRTADDGSFRMREVPRGPVIVTAAGRDATWTPASQLLEVGASPLHVDLRLGIGATLEGTIVENGKPLRGCTIHLFCSQPDQPVSYLFNLLATRQATSDKQGNFRIVGILPGQVEMRATRKGLEILGQQTIPMAEGQTLRWDFDCSSGARFPIDITIEPPVSPGKSGGWMAIIYSGGESAPNMQMGHSNPAGKMRVEGISDGRCTALVYFQPEGGDFVQILSHEFDAREGQLALRIPPEKLRLQPIRGRAVDATGQVLAEHPVKLNGIEQQVRLQRTTATDGTFSFPGLPPGRYQLTIEAGPLKGSREFTLVGDREEDLGDVILGTR